MAKYLVTGGAGFIGSNIVEELLKRGEDVRVLDDFSTGRRENLSEFEGGIELMEGSITDYSTCEKACESVTYVLHQAALPSVPRSIDDPVACDRINVGGTVNMLRAAQGAGAKRFVYASSSSVYGDTPELPKHEGMTPAPLSPYAASKLAGEYYCRVFFEVYGLETVSFRYFNIFGPRQDPNSEYGAVIPIFSRHLLRGESPPVHGGGGQTRDFTFVTDAVEANLNACTAPPACAGEVMNIGAGGRKSVLDLFYKLRELFGCEGIDPTTVPPRPGDVRDSYASIEKAGSLIGYSPKYDVETGLELAADYYRKVCG